MLNLLRILLMMGTIIASQLETFVTNGDYISFERYVTLNRDVCLAYKFVTQTYDSGNLLHMIVELNTVDPQRFIDLALDIGIDINSPTYGDRLNRALTLASRFGNIAAVNYLLERGANIHVLNKNQRTPLMVAFINMRIDIIEILIRAYESKLQAMENDERKILVARLNIELDSRGDNLLLLAIGQKAPTAIIEKMVHSLNLFWIVPAGRKTCLMAACQKRDSEFLLWILQKPGVRDLIDFGDGYGHTVLTRAISAKNIVFVKILLEHGADTQHLTIFQESYLQQAINEDVPEEIIKLLLIHNARTDIQSIYNQPDIISFCANRGNFKAKEMLLELNKFNEVAPLFLEHLPSCLWNVIRTIYINSL